MHMSYHHCVFAGHTNAHSGDAEATSRESVPELPELQDVWLREIESSVEK